VKEKLNVKTQVYERYKAVLWFCLHLQQRTRQLLSPASPVGWGGESEGKRQKLTGWDENNLTEWQREKKTTVNHTDEKHVQHAVFSPPEAQLLLSSVSLSFSQLPA